MPNFEIRGAMPMARVAAPLARLLRGVARRERLIRECIAGSPRGQELVERLDRLFMQWFGR